MASPSRSESASALRRMLGRLVPTRPWVAGVLTSAALITVYYVMPFAHFQGRQPVLGWFFLVTALLLVAALTVTQAVSAARGVPWAMGFGLPVAVCLVLVVFSAIYFVAARGPGAFAGLSTKTDSLYFTVTTLSTVGYGDIHPVGQQPRIVVTVQILFDLVLVGGVAGSLRRGAGRRLGERRESGD